MVTVILDGSEMQGLGKIFEVAPLRMVNETFAFAAPRHRLQ